MNIRKLLLVGSLIMVLATATSAQELAHVTVASDGINVGIVLENDHGEQALIVTFTTTDPKKHPIFCLAAHRDITYALRNSSGNVVSVARNFRDEPDPYHGSVFGPGALKDPCATLVTQKSTRIWLSDPYPNLPHGNYTLWVTFTPPNGDSSVAATPIPIRV